MSYLFTTGSANIPHNLSRFLFVWDVVGHAYTNLCDQNLLYISAISWVFVDSKSAPRSKSTIKCFETVSFFSLNEAYVSTLALSRAHCLIDGQRGGQTGTRTHEIQHDSICRHLLRFSSRLDCHFDNEFRSPVLDASDTFKDFRVKDYSLSCNRINRLNDSYTEGELSRFSKKCSKYYHVFQWYGSL